MKSRTFIMGLSDFYALTTSIMKLTYTKGNPKVKLYRNYKNFENDFFKIDLENGLRNLILTYTTFEKVFQTTLNYHAPIKKKILQANENCVMSKALRKAIVERSRMENLYLKNKTDLNWRSYIKQRNFCTGRLHRTKKEYFSKLGLVKISGSK